MRLLPDNKSLLEPHRRATDRVGRVGHSFIATTCNKMVGIDISQIEVVSYIPQTTFHMVKIATFGLLSLVGYSVVRLTWMIFRYRHLRRKYLSVPCIWDDREKPADLPLLIKAMPSLMKASKTGDLQKYSESSRDPNSGKIRPIIYIGPSVQFDPVVCVADSHLFGTMLNDLESFPKYTPIYDILSSILGNGLVTAVGEEHRRQRKAITPVFHFAALKSAMTAIEKSALELVDSDLVSDGLVLTNETFRRFTLSVITDYAFSGAFDRRTMERSWKKITTLIPLHFILTRFLGDVAKLLPTAFNLHTLLMRWSLQSLQLKLVYFHVRIDFRMHS